MRSPSRPTAPCINRNVPAPPNPSSSPCERNASVARPEAPPGTDRGTPSLGNRTDEHIQDLADRTISGVRFAQRNVSPDHVTVASTVSLLDDAARGDQVG